MGRRRRWMIVLIVVAVVLVFYVGPALVGCRMILRPPRRTLGEQGALYGRSSAADYRMRYEPFEVASGDITIRGWVVRPSAGVSSGRAVIVIHGHADNRVGMLHFLPLLEPLKATVVLMDLRAHGESGGETITYGVTEREDVRAVIDRLIAQGAARPGGVALVGYSLGGAVALQTAAAEDRVGAVVADGTFARLRGVVYRRARQIFILGVPAVPLAIRLAEWRGGFSAWEASPLSLAGRVRCPVLLIHGATDPLVRVDEAEDLRAALGEKAQLWVIPDAGHCQGFDADEAAYIARVREFLEAHLPK